MKLFVKKRPIDYILYSVIIVVGIIVDQISKYLIQLNMEMFESIPVINKFFHITYTTNDGMAFGMMDGPGQRWVFIIVSTVAIIAFAIYLYLGHADNMLYGTALSMVVSGGIGNMIDRLGFGFYVNPETGMGEVIDFIDFCGIWNAIFNIADSFVCVGAGLLVLALVIDIVKEFKNKNKAEAVEASAEGNESSENEDNKEE